MLLGRGFSTLVPSFILWHSIEIEWTSFTRSLSEWLAQSSIITVAIYPQKSRQYKTTHSTSVVWHVFSLCSTCTDQTVDQLNMWSHDGSQLTVTWPVCMYVWQNTYIRKRAGNILHLWHNTNCWSDTCMASVHPCIHQTMDQLNMWSRTGGHVVNSSLSLDVSTSTSSEWINPVHITLYMCEVQCCNYSIRKPSDTELYCWLRVAGVVEIG